MFVTSGIKSPAMSAFIVKVSVSASPIVMFPSALMFPVACKLPVILVSPKKFTVPVPCGLNSKFPLTFVA